MNKNEYLDELKTKLSGLTEKQVNETIQYYSDYFDDAKNDEKVINELGNTDELSTIIIQKYTNQIEDQQEKAVSEDEYIDEKALFYSYEPTSVKNLSLIFGAAHIVMIHGKKFSVETRGIEKECLISELTSNGTLSISNNKRINFNFWSHDRNYRAIPRILITVPENVSLNRLKINVGAGNFEAKNTVIKCEKALLEVGAGNLNAGTVNGGSVDFRCGMGNLVMKGIVTGKSEIDCGMGSISLKLSGDENDYSYDAKIGLGNFLLNNQKKGGFGKEASENKKDNHFSVSCGVGSVVIKIQ